MKGNKYTGNEDSLTRGGKNAYVCVYADVFLFQDEMNDRNDVSRSRNDIIRRNERDDYIIYYV